MSNKFMSNKIVSIDCSREIRFEGSQVTGSVNLNTKLASEKDISVVKVSLNAWIHTWIESGHGKVGDNEPIFQIEHILWSNDSFPDHPYEIISLPFSFTIPDSANDKKPLPASLFCGDSSDGGHIQFYVHCIVEKRAWYKQNTHVKFPFPFLPLDRTSAPSLDFDSWTGPWMKTDNTIIVRPNTLKLFGNQGSVKVSVYLPRVDSLPLFVRIPCRIYIICCSKPMPSSHSLDPTSFTFPRNPKIADISLRLIQRNEIVVRHHHRRFTESHGLLGGFGALQNLANIEMEVSDPIWVPEGGSGDRGKWTESVKYSAHLVLRCPTPVNTRLIRTEVNIEVKIDLPGPGNSWKMSIGPLPISSGVKTPQKVSGGRGSTAYDIAVPPSYWEVMSEGNSKDEKEKS